jgi:hypothetical protein
LIWRHAGLRKFAVLFFDVAVLWFLQGFWAKMAFLLWCFCGEFVVDCVVNVVEKPRDFAGGKIGQTFEVYFRVEQHFALRRGFPLETDRREMGL